MKYLHMKCFDQYYFVGALALCLGLLQLCPSLKSFAAIHSLLEKKAPPQHDATTLVYGEDVFRLFNFFLKYFVKLL